VSKRGNHICCAQQKRCLNTEKQCFIVQVHYKLKSLHSKGEKKKRQYLFIEKKNRKKERGKKQGIQLEMAPAHPDILLLFQGKGAIRSRWRVSPHLSRYLWIPTL
jgi:hypothetical protein